MNPIPLILKLFGGRLGASIAVTLGGMLLASLAGNVWSSTKNWWVKRQHEKQIETLQDHISVLGLDIQSLKTSNTSYETTLAELEAAQAQGEAMREAMESRNTLLVDQVREAERIQREIQLTHREELERAYARNVEWAACRWPDDVVDSMCDYYEAIGVPRQPGSCEGPGLPADEVPGQGADGSPADSDDVAWNYVTGDDGPAPAEHYDLGYSERTQGGAGRYGVQ